MINKDTRPTEILQTMARFSTFCSSPEQSGLKTLLTYFIIFTFALIVLPSVVRSQTIDLSEYSTQIRLNEAESIIDELREVFGVIETRSGAYSPDLIEPSILLGDAERKLGDLTTALEHYDRALHLTRTNFGLFSPEQADIVYRQSSTYLEMRSFILAQEKEEYAYEVLSRAYGSNSPDLLPAIQRMGEFYLKTFNFLGARALYKKGLRSGQDAFRDEPQNSIPFLKGIADSYKLERFPPYYVEDYSQNAGQSGIRDLDLTAELYTINNFPAGERALQEIISIRRQQFPQTVDPEFTAETLDATELQGALELNQATLDLADWHLLFGRVRDARTLYAYIFEQNAKLADKGNLDFSSPSLLYVPTIKPLIKTREKAGREPSQGIVKVTFEVNANGRVRNMETVESYPKGLMDFRVRRTLRDAIYRPKIDNSGAVNTTGQTFEHKFEHYELATKTPESAEKEGQNSSETAG